MYQPPPVDPGSRRASTREQLRDLAFTLLLFSIVCSSLFFVAALELEPPFDWLPLLGAGGIALLLAFLYERQRAGGRHLAQVWLAAGAMALAVPLAVVIG